MIVQRTEIQWKVFGEDEGPWSALLDDGTTLVLIHASEAHEAVLRLPSALTQPGPSLDGVESRPN